tara:strand:- start:7537 stop:8001 length:465 start_codon:yes stop_codon:yes gene_type:complete
MKNNKGGRKYSTEQMIRAIRETRGLLSIAAERLGCHPDTIRAYARRYPTIAKAIKEERERMTDVAELSLYNKIQDGEGWAVSLYLRTQGRHRGYVEQKDIKLLLGNLTDDELRQLVERCISGGDLHGIFSKGDKKGAEGEGGEAVDSPGVDFDS